MLVESGEIEISVDGRVINRLGPGAGVGEIALLEAPPRTATVDRRDRGPGYAVDAPTFLAAIAGPAAAAVTERMAAGEPPAERSGARPGRIAVGLRDGAARQRFGVSSKMGWRRALSMNAASGASGPIAK